MAKLDELRVEGSKKREDFLKKVKRHEVGGDERGVEVVELMGDELIEAMEGGGCRRGGTHLREVCKCVKSGELYM